MKKNTLYLIMAIIGGALLRLHKITTISLWHDEAFSATLINYHSWGEMIHRIGLDVHPPLYYILLKFWSQTFGNTLTSLRGFSLFFGVATIYATYLFVKEAFRKEGLAVAAAVLIAVNPFQIQYVTEARMYTLGSFLIMISAYFLVRALRDDHNWKKWALCAIGAAACIYTHYFLLFSVFAGFVYAMFHQFSKYRFNLKEYRYGLGATLLSALLFLPWLKTFIFQFSQVQENYWIPKINTWSIPSTLWKMLIGTNIDTGKHVSQILMVLVTLFSIYFVYVFLRKEEAKEKWLVATALIFPFLGGIVSSVRQSIYLDRYFIFASLFYTIALAAYIYNLKNLKAKYILFGLAIFISVFAWAKNWQDLHTEDKPGMADAAEYINSGYKQGDKIFIGSSFEFFNYNYYNETGEQALLYTPGIKQVSDLPHFSGTAILDNSELIHDFGSGTKQGDTVWLLWTNAFGASKPETPQNWTQIDEHGWQDARPYPGTWIIVTEYRVK